MLERKLRGDPIENLKRINDWYFFNISPQTENLLPKAMSSDQMDVFAKNTFLEQIAGSDHKQQ